MGVLTGCQPRPEVLQGELDDAIFAADFGDVIADRGPAVYRDPVTFFRNTHPAARLRKLVELVFARLADPNEAGAIIRLSTGFGGGKTHSLIALYHLAKHVADLTLGTDLLPAAGRPSRVHVVAVDAQKPGSKVFSVREGRQIKSLWGEVFHQLDGLAALDVLGRADDPEESPSESQLETVLPSGPLLILLDELVIYMARLSDRGQGNVLGFLQTLMSVVARRPRTALLVTDPAEQRAYQREAAQLGTAVGAATVKLDDIYGRKVSEFNPIEGEAARVIVRRLFEKVDEGAAQRTSAVYHELYKRVIADEPTNLPSGVTEPDYARRIVECYPFHPRLLDTAQDRLGALPSFQRSRGVLRLFARIIRDVWEAQRDIELISAGEIDWASDRIRQDLLQRLGLDPLSAAADADVDRHAGELDGGAPRGVHRRVASALLLESLPLQPNSGLDRAEATLAVLRPDEAGHEPGEALERLAGHCWHIYPLPSGRAWQFRIEPNVIKQVEERMGRISGEDAKSRVQLEARQYFSGPQLKLAAWPRGAKDVPDTFSTSTTLQLVLCDDEALARRVCDLSDDADPQAPMPRRYRNAIVAVAPTPDAYAEAIERAQRLLAVEQIEKELRGESHRIARDQLARLKPEYQKQFRLQVIRAFDRVIRAGAESKRLTDTIQTSDDNVLRQQVGQAVLTKFLEDNKQVYGPTEELDSDLFVGKVLASATPVVGTTDTYTAKAIHEQLLAASGLRLVRDGGVVRRSILRAVRDGKVVVRVGDRAYDARGSVAGPPGNRQRDAAALDTVSLDEATLVAEAESTSARAWLQVKAPPEAGHPSGKCTDGAGPYVVTPPPRVAPPATPVTVYDAALLAEHARTRPLLKLSLGVASPDAARRVLALASPLNAESLAWDISVSGSDSGGVWLSFSVRDAKPNHGIKPLETAAMVSRVLGEGATYDAKLALDFGAGRSGLADALEALAARLPADTQVFAEFDRPA